MTKNKLQYLSLLLFLTYLLNSCVPCIPVHAEAISTPVFSFSDLAGHWAEKGIKAWTARGLAGGYPDGTFRPDSPITRAEFLALLNRAVGYSEMTVGQAMAPASYCDVTETDWYAGEIAKAAAVGYLGGYPDGTIRPQNSITRQEVAALFARVLPVAIEFSEVDNFYLNNDKVLKDFTDEAQIPEWSREAIVMAVNDGYMNGYPDGTFRPAKAITRAEAISVLDRAVGTLYNHAGTYGPFRGNLVLEGNVTITTPSVTLQNTTITGNLYLTEGIGEGEVTLDNVTVQGTTKIGGGGSDSIHLIDTTIGSVLVNVPNRNLVRLLAQGSTAVGTLEARTPARLEEKGLTGAGFTRVRINNQQGTPIIVELLGELSEAEIHSPAVQLNVQKGSINSLTLASAAQASQSAQSTQSVQINLAAQTAVANLIADTPVVAQGQGTIETTLANVDGVVIETPAKNVFLVDGVRATVEGKTITENIIGAEIKKKKSKDATLSDLILKGVTGRATIPGFDPDILSYDVVLPCGSDESDLPLIEATAHHAKARVTVTQAEGFTPSNNTATILVTAESGRTQTYTICFSVALDTAKAITDFRLFAGMEYGEPGVDPVAVGMIHEEASPKTISVTVPHGTDVTALMPIISHTSESISPASGEKQNFTNPVLYTVTAVDGSTAEYTVTVTVLPSADTALAVFTIGTEVVYDVLELDLPGNLTGEDGAILAVYDFGDLKGITVEPFSADVQSVTVTVNGTEIAKDDLSKQVIKDNDVIVVMVVAESGNTAQYTVKVVPISVTGVSLNKAVMFLQVGTTAEEPLIATVVPNEATNREVIWSSSDETIAIVNATGLVTTKSTGTVKITATTVDGGKEAICWVKVVASDSVIPVIDDSCVLYLDGSIGNASASDTWHDLSGKGNHGTLNNFAYAEGSGWTGQGLEFDGKSDYVDCGNDGSLTPNHITIDFSLTLYGLEDNSGIFAKGNNSNRTYWMWVYGGDYRLNIGNGDNYSLNLPPAIGEKHHFIITYDGSSIKVYVDGVLDTNIPQQKGVLTHHEELLKIGFLNGHSSGKYGNFQMSFFRIYNRVLTPEEIAQNHLATKDTMALEDGAVLDLRGVEGQYDYDNSKWLDVSGNGNDATLMGFTVEDMEAGYGWIGNGVKFDGVDAYGDCGNESSLLLDKQCTIMAWIKPKAIETTGDNFQGIIGSTQAPDYNWLFRLSENTNLEFRSWQGSGGTGGESVVAEGVINPDELVFVSAVVDLNAGYVKLGKNGSTILERDFTIPLLNNNCPDVTTKVGVYATGSWSHFKGTIYGVRIYPKSLTDAEVMQNFLIDKYRYNF